jgi:hypothetical protein
MYAKEKHDKAARIKKGAFMAAGKRTQKTLLELDLQSLFGLHVHSFTH